MKGKNSVFIAKSLDGFIAGKNNELDWLEMIPNPEHNDLGFDNLMNEIDAIVMGKTTFETVLGFGGAWPYEKHLFVLSTSLKSVPEKLQEKVTLLKGSVQEILKSIHAKGFYNLYIDGGKTVQNFLKEDVIDELRMTTIPVLLGEGISLFDILPTSLEFTHLKTEVFLNELVQSHYSRKRRKTT